MVNRFDLHFSSPSHHNTTSHSPTTSSSSSSSPASSSPDSPPMNPKTHKHYQSHAQPQPHIHVDTPYPLPEPSDTSSSTSSTHSGSGSTTSFLDIRKHTHDVQQKLTSHIPIPNPLTATTHHITELKFGHTSRAAKREARRSAAPWSVGAAQMQIRAMPILEVEMESEGDAEEWRERDQRAWEAELRRREAARNWVGEWTGDGEGKEGRV